MFTKNFYKCLPNVFADSYNAVAVINYSGASSKFTGNAYLESCTEFRGKLMPTLRAKVDASYPGVIIGTGTTPPALDDYCLSGDLITTFTGSVNITQELTDDGVSYTALYTITNIGTESFTIGEIGMYGGVTSGVAVLLERTVLDSPITIPAGSVGQVTYTIRFNYPTA